MNHRASSISLKQDASGEGGGKMAGQFQDFVLSPIARAKPVLLSMGDKPGLRYLTVSIFQGSINRKIDRSDRLIKHVNTREAVNASMD